MKTKAIAALLTLLFPIFAAAHPGGGLIALDANTVVFGDSMYNTVWRLEKGKKPQALITNFHAHWTTLGLDGHIYSESFQEMGGALFRISQKDNAHIKIADESHIAAPVFAVGRMGEIVFQKGQRIMQRSSTGVQKPFRGAGMVAKGEPPLRSVIAFAWGADETLYLSDSHVPGVGNVTAPASNRAEGARLRQVGKDGVIRLVAQVNGTLIEPGIWNSASSTRIWSIAGDDRKRIYTALPDIGKVVRIDPDGSQHVIDESKGDWRVTAVTTYADSVFLLESSASTNDGPRVRVIRGAGKTELLGQVEPPA